MTTISATTENVDFKKMFRFTQPGSSNGKDRETQPKMLFDECWLEGELAIMFGDTGKTALAVQIGESIARGRPIEPMRIDAEARKVVYLDLGLTQRQFDLRYCGEIEDDKGEILTEEYEFSDNFCRIEMQPDMTVSGIEAFRTLAKGFEWIVKKTGTKVLILDNITCLRQSAYGSRGEVILIKELDRLKRQYGISILVLVNTERRNMLRELTVLDLGSSLILSKFADSIFAVGQSDERGPFRYIKQLRAKSTEVIYDGDHTPTFELCKIDGKFLGFEFEKYTDETENREFGGNGIDRESYDEVHKLAAEGMSIREIAAHLEMSKSSVHRSLHLNLQPGPEPPPKIDWEEERRKARWFPGCEEYDKIDKDPMYDGIYAREDDEAYRLRREGHLVQTARAYARQHYLKNGEIVPFAEMFKEVSGGHSFPYRYDEVIKPVDPDPALDEAPEIEPVKLADEQEIAAAQSNEMGENDRPDGIPPNLDRELDDYGRPMFVESRNGQNKPRIYYQRDKQGNIHRFERRAEGRFGTIIKFAHKTKKGRPEQNGSGEVRRQ